MNKFAWVVDGKPIVSVGPREGSASDDDGYPYWNASGARRVVRLLLRRLTGFCFGVLLARDPNRYARIKDIQRESASVQNLVMKTAHVIAAA